MASKTIPDRRRQRNVKDEPWTYAQLEAFWRGTPDFIGPVGPPMVLWLRDREKQKLWRKRHGLHPREDEG